MTTGTDVLRPQKPGPFILKRPLSERLRALDLDDEARKQLGPHVLVTRNGSRLFLYTATETHAAESARILQQLVDADHLTAEISTTRWNPSEEEWQDASSLAGGPAETDRVRDRELREERERSEAQDEGAFDWYVHVTTRSRDEAAALEQHLRSEALATHRRWTHVTLAATTEAHAHELAALIRREDPDAEIEVEPHVDLPPPLFVFIRSLI